MKKIGILSVQGLPARYGAFEQTVDQIVRYAARDRPDLHFIVGSNKESASEPYDMENVTRLFFKRGAGIGVINYGLKAFVSMYLRGVRTFLIMGYGLAPFFWLFELLGCQLVCNVDGFEWRRAKWGRWARKYFKLCETFSVGSRAKLIYDSIGVARYYSIKHSRTGHTLFYGTEPLPTESLPELETMVGSTAYYVVVMRMEPENHILEIVRAFQLSKTHRRLILIGPSTPFFVRDVKPLIDGDTTGRIVWLGAIYDRPKLQALRAGAYAYIHGHSVGGTNPTLVEACWLGRPVIAYASIFNREVLGAAGTYFPDERGLTVILNDDSRVLPLPPRLDARYTWENVCHGYIQLVA
jgi:glycosyltransferase involved in cell wall biosynthesis